MSHEIIKQPNGLFAVWSTITDSLIMTDATPEDIIEKELDDAEESVRKYVYKAVKALNEQGHYMHFRNWEEAINYRNDAGLDE